MSRGIRGARERLTWYAKYYHVIISPILSKAQIGGLRRDAGEPGLWKEGTKRILSVMLLNPGGVNPPTSITGWRELVKMAPLGAQSFGVHCV